MNLWNHVHEIWINPEIERRKELGSIPADFRVYAAQVMSFTDCRDNEIRLNEEVKAILIAIASRTLKPNEQFNLEDGISEIKNIELPEDDDPNAGHLTILKFKGKWTLVFDFRYNKKMARERLDAAGQFYESAKLNYERGLMRPAIENLFAAAELLATAQQHHTGTINRYTAFVDIGNYKVEHTETLLELKTLRTEARYLEKDFLITPIDIEKYLNVVNDMHELTQRLLTP